MTSPWGAENKADTDPVAERLKHLRRPLAATLLGLWAERLWQAFWPFATVIMLMLAALMLGLQDGLALETVWALIIFSVLFAVAGFGRGIWYFERPSRVDAMMRLDQSLPGRPLSAVLDRQAIGADDPASAALWQAHQQRMAARLEGARAARPDLNIALRDPYALRYSAALVLVVAFVFGSLWRVGTVADAVTGGSVQISGPSWEGWLSPPRYTGLPVLYLGDQKESELTVPAGSEVALRFYGEVGDLVLDETVSGRTGDVPVASEVQQDFTITQDGSLSIDGPGGRSWSVQVVADLAPEIEVLGQAELTEEGALTLPFAARDDYGIRSGQVRIALDLLAVDRRHGLATDPDPRPDLELELPLPLTGSRAEFTEHLIDDFAKHPWAHLPVTITLLAQDAAGQTSSTAPFGTELVAPRFFDPLAAAIIEQRRDLLWARDNGPRIAQILRTLSYEPDDLFRSAGDYLRLRAILRDLEAAIASESGLTETTQTDLAEALWQFATELEEGDVGDALARMQRAQERLSQAMRDGASNQEIARLMQELRDATQDYLRQLRRQAETSAEESDQGESSDNVTQLSQDDLQAMMDRIQELMEQGRMAEAEQALREFQQMMENMRVTQGQQGQGQDPGQQAMEGLGETLRDQQGLSDRAFRDLQEQFNGGAQQGQSQGNEGRNGGLGRGQSHEGQGGQNGSGESGAQGQAQPRPGEQGADGPGGEDGRLKGDLAQRQQELRDELQRQRDGLPLGGAAGDAVRDSLDRAGRAMEGAEQALRDGDLAEALDQQSDAMEALREGMRSLGEAMAQHQQPGQADGDAQPGTRTDTAQQDPLGRQRGADGFSQQDNGYGLGGDSPYRRAWNLLEEIRRRAAEQDRPESERNYLERLFDRF